MRHRAILYLSHDKRNYGFCTSSGPSVLIMASDLVHPEHASGIGLYHRSAAEAS
ncbi:hypothetical protein BKA56DRAFT_593622 [Ilyonectria sp. MPI-CAGE-AT-0026]|nr:hypothetical protein BKA56DRAFT_593622 [Ilyonectria sp. MPI-CAGE-AT-0026]